MRPPPLSAKEKTQRKIIRDDQRNSLFSNISNRPVSVVDLLGKGLNDNQVFKAVLTFLELTGLDHRI